MQTASKSGNPLYTIAAIAVILFSGVGIATMVGWIPSSQSRSTDAMPPANLAAVPGDAVTKGNPAPTIAMAGSPPPADAAPAPAGMAPPSAGVPPPGSAPVAAPPPCAACGVVRSVHAVEVKGQGTGLGAVAGGVLGAVVGHQVGQGGGNTLATVIGAGGGALAGNTVEQNVRKSTHWNVTVDMATGGERTFRFANPPAFGAGEQVRISNGQLLRN